MKIKPGKPSKPGKPPKPQTNLERLYQHQIETPHWGQPTPTTYTYTYTHTEYTNTHICTYLKY